MAQQEEYSGFQSLLNEFNTKLRDLEEKNNLIKDRVLLIGNNLIKNQDEIGAEIIEIKKQLLTLQQETEKLKSVMQRVIEETDNFARKQDIEAIEKWISLFDPSKFATVTRKKSKG